MNLDDAQRKKVAEWIGQGAKISEIQNRLQSELKLKLTYIEVRLLVDDLKLIPKDPEIPKAAAPSPLANDAPAPSAAAKTEGAGLAGAAVPDAGGAGGGVSLSVDQLARPGALVSGKVKFSDGKTAEWYLDQTGRLGMVAPEAGYRPPAADVPQFQMALEKELARMGM
jgi:hypothetical protein